MSAAHHERHVWFNFAFTEKWREQMAFEMIDGELRFAKTDREAFSD